MDKPVVAGIDLYARETEYEESGYKQESYGFGVRGAFPVTEYVVMSLRYNLRRDKVESAFQRTSPYLNDSEGRFTTSSVGYGLVFDQLDNRQRPSSGQRIVFNQDFAGVGGNVSYLRNSLTYDFYIPVFGEWVLNFNAQGGHLLGIGKDIRINDRFFLGGPRMRGFSQAGVGPKDRNTSLALADDPLESLGGNSYYKGGAELFVPLGSGAKELGIEVSTYVDVGALFTLDEPDSLPDDFNPAVTHVIRGDTASPRVSVGVGISWSSPFGPFRLDFAKALKKQDTDETEFFQFNIGTRF